MTDRDATAPKPSEEDRERAARWIRENAPSLCWDDGSIGEDDLDSLTALLASVRAEGEPQQGVDAVAEAQALREQLALYK